MTFRKNMPLWSSDSPLVQEVDIVLLDLDGVVYLGLEPVPGAQEAIAGIRSAGKRLGYVTNNSSREPESVAEQLNDLGIPSDPKEVVSSAHAAALLLKERLTPGAPVLVVGGAGLRRAVHDVGLVVVDSADDSPVAVVQGFSPELGWKELAEAAYALRAGAFWVATNVDITLPTERGLAPGNGSLVGAVRLATGLEPVSAGKPEPALFTQAVTKLGGGSALMIGDRLDTDLAGSNSAGLPGLLVLTGVSGVSDLLYAQPNERPQFIGRDLRAVLDSHPVLVQSADGWDCRNARAEIVNGNLELSTASNSRGVDSDPVDLLRAACAAVWASSGSDVQVSGATMAELEALVALP